MELGLWALHDAAEESSGAEKRCASISGRQAVGDANERRADRFRPNMERATAVSPTRGGGNYAALSPDCNTYVYDSNATGSTALWMVPSSGGAATKIADAGGISDIEWFPDNRGVIYLAGGRVSAWIRNGGGGNVVGVPTNGRMTVDLAAERHEMIYEAGRELKNDFTMRKCTAPIGMRR